MDMLVGSQSPDVWAWDLGPWARDVAQVEDQVGLVFRPGGEVWTGIWAVVGRVGGGHGMVRVAVVFGVHFGGDRCVW